MAPGVFLLAALAATGIVAAARGSDAGAERAAIPPPQGVAFPSRVDLGRTLFFDPRLSGDGATSCATCHIPDRAWTDGRALSAGYTSVLYFRNTPTLLNAGKAPLLTWDGRFEGKDLDSVVRDHLAEAHFMNMDGLLLVERMRQVPDYEEGFKALYGGEVSFGKVLDALSQFVATLESQDHRYLKYQRGDAAALTPEELAGLELFKGKAGCSSCHSGELLTDGEYHAPGVPENSEVFSEPARHITFRRFFKQFGVGDFVTLRHDPGLFALTHDEADRGKFRTPSLLEAARTAPYMHNGAFGTLEEVVRFYDSGGGDGPNKDPGLKPLGLSAEETEALIAFLKTLGSSAGEFQKPAVPDYAPRRIGDNR